MLGRIEPREYFGRDVCLENVPVDAFFAAHLQQAFIDRFGVFAGSIDRQQLADRPRVSGPGTEGQKGETVAEPTGPVNCVRIACVDPQMQPVAVFDPRGATPDALLLAGHTYGEGQS